MGAHNVSFPYGKIRSAGDIGAAIRAKRRAIGMRQEELASLAGVGPRFLSEVENGKASAEIGKAIGRNARQTFHNEQIPCAKKIGGHCCSRAALLRELGAA